MVSQRAPETRNELSFPGVSGARGPLVCPSPQMEKAESLSFPTVIGRGLEVADGVFLTKQAVAQIGWGCDFIEF